MRVLKFILEMLFWVFAAGAVVFLVAVAVGLVMTPALGYLAGLAVLGSLPLAVRTMRAVRRRRGAMALSHLAHGVRLNLPLPRALYAAEVSESGMLAARLEQLRLLLQEGYPVGAALAMAVPELPERDAAMVEAGERIGRLPQALARVLHLRRTEAEQAAASDATFARAYPVMMVVALGLVGAMIMVFVIPKYEQIFSDFGQRLPPITRAAVAVARQVGAPLLFAIVAVVMISSGLALWQTIHPQRFGASTLRRMIDHLRWRTPFVHGWDRDRGLADAFELIADALAAGVPLERALAEAAQLDLNTVLEARVRRWSQLASAGESLPEAARRAGMPRLACGMLATARGAETIDVFRFLARYYRTRFSRTATLLRGAIVPLLVLAFALLVGSVAAALFLPMIDLIDSLSHQALLRL